MIHILHSPDGAQAQIALNGAHVISWIPAGRTEQLFLSKASQLESGSAIRGGVPVIFPQFAGLGNLPKHGFARTQLWRLRESQQADRAVFELRDNEATRQIWPHSFLAELSAIISGATLEIELMVQNTGSASFSFTAALHTYLRVDDIADTRILGLQGVNYSDKVNGVDDCVEANAECAIVGQVDRIYFNAPESLTVQQKNHSTLIQHHGFSDTVVWNPGSEVSAAMADMEQLGYQRMLCVEGAAIGNAITLQADEKWKATQRLEVI